MIKQTLTAAVAISALALSSTPVWADTVVDDGEYSVMPISLTDETTPINLPEDSNYPDERPHFDHLDCSNALDCIEETEDEPAVWPMYLSLGALGLALLVFIILNLFGGKKKQ